MNNPNPSNNPKKLCELGICISIAEAKRVIATIDPKRLDKIIEKRIKKKHDPDKKDNVFKDMRSSGKLIQLEHMDIIKEGDIVFDDFGCPQFKVGINHRRIGTQYDSFIDMPVYRLQSAILAKVIA